MAPGARIIIILSSLLCLPGDCPRFIAGAAAGRPVETRFSIPGLSPEFMCRQLRSLFCLDRIKVRLAAVPVQRMKAVWPPASKPDHALIIVACKEYSMICALFVPIDVKVFVEINNLVVNLKGESGGNTSVAALPWADFSTMKAGEKLFLCGHGDTDSAGGGADYYTPKQLAKKLVNQGLPGHITSIRMLTCESGTSVNGMANQAYCVRLAEEIRSRAGFSVPVLGFRGPQVTNQFGQTRGANPVLPPHLAAGYSTIIANWANQLLQWEGFAANLPTSSGQEIINGSRTMAKMTKPLFAQLYAHNEQTVLSKAVSKHWG